MGVLQGHSEVQFLHVMGGLPKKVGVPDEPDFYEGDVKSNHRGSKRDHHNTHLSGNTRSRDGDIAGWDRIGGEDKRRRRT